MNVRIKYLTCRQARRMIEIQKNDGYPHAYYLTKERICVLRKNGEIFYGVYLPQSNKLIGFASVNVDVIRMRVHFFFIDRAFQQQGVGSVLLQTIIAFAKKLHVQNVYTYTPIDSPLERFLQKRGFEKAGYFKGRFGTVDANILSLHL